MELIRGDKPDNNIPDKDETRLYDVTKCECGHTVPYDFAVSNEEGQDTCMPCYIEFLNDLHSTAMKCNGWISIHDKLPTHNEVVQLFTIPELENKNVVEGFLHPTYGWMSSPAHEEEILQVTHWKPL